MDTAPTSPVDLHDEVMAPVAQVHTSAQSGPSSDPAMEKISAFYSLCFPNFTYYLQTLTVTIGRRSVRPGAASSSEQAQVDVDLGPLKSVSRLHARIEYEENQERFVLVVIGRNGAWVDGIWSGSGSRVPLGSRSQIQIASRSFQFVLPPPPDPEDSPSPSSHSTTRHASPSIDITSLSPDSSLPSPPAIPAALPSNPPPPPAEVIKPSPKANGKKRKKRDSEPDPPPPELMPARPTFTHAQLCYRAIKALDGKATLQEVCAWISENYEWYRYNKSRGWESSVRHNLSGNRAFKKLERCTSERGKGFLWSVDPRYEYMFEDPDSKNSSGMKAKGKVAKLPIVPLEPALKRSVKGESSGPLPPPLTSTPLPAFTSAPQLPGDIANDDASTLSSVASSKEQSSNQSIKSEPSASSLLAPSASTATLSSESQPPPAEISNDPNLPPVPPDMIVPIVIGPPVSQSDTTNVPGSSDVNAFDMSYPPIALKGDTIILNPAIFSNLTSEQLKELEQLGARKAIEILQSYIVRFLKEKIKTEGIKGKTKKKSKSKRVEGSSAASADGKKDQPADSSASSRKPKVDISSNPFTTAPLAMRKPPSSAPAVTPMANNPTPATVVPVHSAMLYHIPVMQPVAPQPLRTTSPMMNGLQAAVAPLRISSPPMAGLADPGDEFIDIMGDDNVSTEEPVAKRRRLEADAAATAVS